ncbi:MAG: hypothetical protein ACKVRN_13620 [Pyrinomonadaceae bacterium]
MKKRILISFALVVLLLEVGFGVYVAFERKHQSALSALVLPIDSVKPIQIDADRELQLASLSSGEDLLGDTRTDIVAKSFRNRAVGPKNAVKKPALTSIAATKPSKLRTRAEPGKLAVAIRTTEVREVPAGDANTQKEASRTDNKSFIAKTQTILKKPLGWIKTIGSKLR